MCTRETGMGVGGCVKKKLREPEKNKLTNTKMKLDGEEM